LEILLEVVIYYFLSVPGAVIRWILMGGKRNIHSILKDSLELNAVFAIGLILVVLVAWNLFRSMPF
jgi:hypothetical protein